MHLRNCASWFLIASCVLFARAAHADFLLYQINGIVADTSSSSGYTPLYDELGFVPFGGDALTLIYKVDKSTPGSSPVPGYAQYFGALSSVVLSINHRGEVGTISVPIPDALDGYVLIYNNANMGSSGFLSGYFAAVAPSDVPDTGTYTGLLYYALAQSASPLSPPLYADTSIAQTPLPPEIPGFYSYLGIRSELRRDGTFAASNDILATYTSASISTVPLPVAGWLLLSGLTGIAALRRRTIGKSVGTLD